MKICSKCSTQVSDDLQFCPNCGNNLDSGVQMNNNEVETQQPIQTAQPTQTVVGSPSTNNINYKLVIAIMAGVIVVCVILALIFGLKLFGGKDTKSNENTEPNSSEITPTEDKNVITYNGFEFTLPDGYKKVETDNGMLEIDNGEYIITLGINNQSFKSAVNNITNRLKIDVSRFVVRADGHNYVWIPTPGLDGNPNHVVVGYCYEYGEEYVFTGSFANVALTDPGEAGFNVLKSFVSTAKKNSSFSANDSEGSSADESYDKAMESIS